MGIPGLYRWLVARYPDTLCSVAEDRAPSFDGPRTDTTKPNPNGVEFDNLYIDMNGVIHPCFHPEGLPVPQSYDDVFTSIFGYIDRVFSIVRPRKLMFLAVDGVAPRAKMNHQRIRRFRAAKEAFGKRYAESDKKMDSNVITPGTEFMALLNSALKYYVHMRMNTDPGWKNIKVILSDSTVVGEGEHKIMSYIRSQRNLSGYDPNTRHCLHGLDADLIMLALATHEIHLSILREVIPYRRKGPTKKSYKSSYVMSIYKRSSYMESMRRFLHDLKFEFFNIWVLREYLERELLPNVKGTDFERLVDDFVFVCLFVGNDFLPKLPSLDLTAEGGIELLLIVYQVEFIKMGYLTDSFKVNLKSMEHFLQALSSHENAIFMKRNQAQMKNRRTRKRQGIKDLLPCDEPIIVELEITTPNLDDVDSTSEEVEVLKGYTRQTYYTEKFDCRSDDFDRIRRDAVLKYTEGVCWVMHYYYQGICSWQWFYPYHYAPLASDFCGLDKLEVHFTLGQPFKPLDQLLGVMPAASAHALPLFYRELMTGASSPILDFYPKKNVKIEKNGKENSWQWVCKLPFIEESRLLSETLKLEHTLTEEEKQRNRLGRDTLFVHREHPLAEKINNHHLSDPSLELQIKIKPELSGGMNGYLCISNKPVYAEKIPSPVIDHLILNNYSVKSVDYKGPSFHAHIPKLPCGVIMPPRILGCQDSPDPLVLWHATPAPSQTVLPGSPYVRKQKEDWEGDEKSGLAKMQDGSVVELGTGGRTENYINNEGSMNGRGNDSDGTLNNGNKSGIDEKSLDENGGEGKRKQKKKKVKGDKLEGEAHLVEACEKPENKVESVLAFADNIEVGGKSESEVIRKKHSKRRHLAEGKDKFDDKISLDENGCEGKRKQKKERVKCDKLEDGHLVEAGVKPENKVESVLVFADNIEIGGKPESEVIRKKHSKRRHLAEGKEKIDDEKPPSKSGIDEESLDENGCEGKRKQKKKRVKVDKLEGEGHLVEAGEKPENKVESVLAFADNIEVGGKPESEVIRKKHSQRRHLAEVKDKIDDEKPPSKSGIDEKSLDENGGEGKRKQKKKRVEGDKLEGEGHLVEACEKPENKVESVLAFADNIEVGGKSESEVIRKKHSKRRHLAEGKDKFDDEKPPSKSGIDEKSLDENGEGKRKQKKKRVKVDKLEGEGHLVEAGEKPENKVESVLVFADNIEIGGKPESEVIGKKHSKRRHLAEGKEKIDDEKPPSKSSMDEKSLDENGCEGKRKQKKKRVKADKLEGEGHLVEAGEKPENKVESVLAFADNIEVGGRPESEVIRKKKKRRHLAEEKEKIDNEKPPSGSKMESGLEIIGGKVHFENMNVESDLSSVVGREICLVEGTDLTKKINCGEKIKKQRRREQELVEISGSTQNKNDFHFSEEIVEHKQKKRKHVKGDMVGVVAEVEQGENEAKRKKHKLKSDMVEDGEPKQKKAEKEEAGLVKENQSYGHG